MARISLNSAPSPEPNTKQQERRHNRIHQRSHMKNKLIRLAGIFALSSLLIVPQCACDRNQRRQASDEYIDYNSSGRWEPSYLEQGLRHHLIFCWTTLNPIKHRSDLIGAKRIIAHGQAIRLAALSGRTLATDPKVDPDFIKNNRTEQLPLTSVLDICISLASMMWQMRSFGLVLEVVYRAQLPFRTRRISGNKGCPIDISSMERLRFPMVARRRSCYGSRVGGVELIRSSSRSSLE